MDERDLYEQGNGNVTVNPESTVNPENIDQTVNTTAGVENINPAANVPVNQGNIGPAVNAPVNQESFSQPVNVNPNPAGQQVNPGNVNPGMVTSAGFANGNNVNYTPHYNENTQYNGYNPNAGQYNYGGYNGENMGGGNPYYEKFKNADNGAAERAARRAAKRDARRQAREAAGKSGFGMTLVKCAAVALVFGLVSGSAFSGITYFTGATGKHSGKNEIVNETPASNTTVDTEDTTKKTTNSEAKVVYTNVTGLADVSEIVKETMPSIVSITNLTTKSTQWFGQIYTEDVEYAGSGIIVGQDEDNLYIATNNHVVSGANTITVTFADETTAVAEVKGTSPSNDLAVVRVSISELASGTLDNIKVATINDSGDTLVGEAAIAIGNALGYGQSVTTGVISAIDREVTIRDDESGVYYSSKLIQTDAAINPGNSGGALLNAQGEVIGINSSKYSDTDVEGMGFAIPMTQAMPIINNLIERNEVDETEAAYIGIGGVDVDSNTAATYGMPTGIYITKIYEGSPASKSELMVGDFIVEFDGTKVSTMEELQDTLKYYPAGTVVTITVQRANHGVYENVEVKVELGKKAEVNLRN